MKKTRVILLVMVISLPVLASPGEPVQLFQEPDGSPGKIHELSLADKKLHPMEGFFYNENYFFIAMTDQGYYGYVNLLVSNTGLEEHQPGISFTIVTPEHERLVTDLDYKAADLESAKDHFELRIKDNYFKETDEGYKLHIRHEDMGMDLEFKNRVPGFVLGDGKAVFGESGEKFFYINYPGPRPDVTGSFLVKGKTVPVKGWGYIDHSLSNSNPASFEDVWHNIKFHSPDYTVLVSSFTTPEEYERDFSLGVITNDEKVLCSFTDVRVKEEDVEVDPESGKAYPAKVHYTLSGDDCSARATMNTSKITEKFDVLAKLNKRWYGRPVKAAINAFIAEPWYYRSVAPVTFKLNVHGKKITTTGQAFNEIIYTD
ncbi:MAG: hypothetical protein R6V10_14295 [bacterium]